jgi:hypothetical protein
MRESPPAKVGFFDLDFLDTLILHAPLQVLCVGMMGVLTGNPQEVAYFI